ncbi:TonB-dependent receptor plug domain-containing protein [Porphyromonadaceae bacterium OttesenSCG-928-L07]|nr:TonB-dependent receptor plug domain-containing protein [Porphyromonadaceae bacterium OttesenSCG-928-L07]MDL2251482.1 TonB-dependent receptor plug domain-containing protein [Odoribacter sp. OttesenSCG-928-J03]MDL2282979.1 TonB-dependent receptor plug domain-containing protein [Odoribacter sp. OttesenSCG-928-G04]MDL2331297.1 TonB-dependent receptor plug domain-containing protein [Odoribacter sp. OttesenSCG-928-A06]
MKIKIGLLLLAATAFNIFPAFAQEDEESTVEQEYFVEQLTTFPQEKVHLHTDKSYYLPGEKIWFKSYIVNAATHELTDMSRYIYVELINPLDSVVKRVKIVTDMPDAGYMELDETLPAGNYCLRAYTHYMQNLDEDYFFKKTVRINSPFAATISTSANFKKQGDQIIAELSFKDKAKKENIKPRIFNTRINNGPIEAQQVKKDNIAQISFKLPKDSQRRIIFIEFDEYRQFVEIPVLDYDFDVAFFPEGGYLLEGTLSKVGFKALNTNGLSEKVRGQIMDNSGNVVQNIQSVHKGMGVFSFIPEKGKSYYAVCQNSQNQSKRFELPVAQTKAYSISTIWKGETLLVAVKTPAGVQVPSSLKLVVHSRGIPQYIAEWNASKEYIALDKTMFPSGVLQVLLLDENNNPLSERLVFCINDDQAILTAKSDKENYNAREKVNLTFHVLDDLDNPLQGKISVAVTDDNYVAPDMDNTILSDLLLTSELKGNIEAPASYFNTEEPAYGIALDVLMMTQGWRRYDIPKIMKGDIQEATIPVEVGQEISGILRSIAQKKPEANGYVKLFSSDMEYANAVETDDSGAFTIDGFNLPEGTKFFLQAESAKGSDNIELVVNDEQFPGIRESLTVSESINPMFYENFMDNADQRYRLSNGTMMIHLQEVIVNNRVPKKPVSPFSHFVDNAINAEEVKESGLLSIKDVLSRIAGVTVTGNQVLIRGKKPALVIDGVPVEPDEANAQNALPDTEGGSRGFKSITTMNLTESSSDSDQSEQKTESLYNEKEGFIGTSLDMIPIDNVENIEVFKGVNARILGLRADAGDGGAISITTKKGNRVAHRPVYNMKQITPLGYQKPIEFYAPKYETAQEKNSNQYDLRTTIYWEPEIELSEDGKATLSFYTADVPSEYSIVIEGIAEEGRIIREVKKISRK